VARVLGIDFGERRIGLAISDPSGTIAQPLPTMIRRAGKRPPVGPIADLIREQDVDTVVIGLPLDLSGDETQWTREVRAFGAKLAERTGAAVEFVDERMTSVRAERAVRELGLKRSDRHDKSRIDAAAAQLILQGFLDQRRHA